MNSHRILLTTCVACSLLGARAATAKMALLPVRPTPPAQPAPPPPPAQPAPPAAPATVAKIRQLIVQLGDPDYAAREDASRQLRAIGKPALPFLKGALADPDIEVASRAQTLVKRLESHPLPGGPFDPTAELRPTRMKMSASADARVLEVSDGQRDIRISQGADGLVMSVTGDLDGERVTEDFTARDADQLKAENPEAYALYERWTGPGNGPGFILRGPMQLGGAGGVQIGGLRGNIQLVGPGAVVGPANAPDELDLLRLRLEKQFREQAVKPDDRDAVVADLAKLADARVNGDMDAYTKHADEFRKTLEARKLDPGDLLPPPAKARLGVSIQTGLVADGGLLVGRIAPDSRGERLGLKIGDVILKVDGQPMTTVADLRKAVSAKEAGITIDLTRNGDPLKLEEKKPAAVEAPAKKG